jgi:Alr-MurF fusion protein
MNYFFTDLHILIKGENLQIPNPSAKISQLLLDSRQISEAKTALFFALVGNRNDGHIYIKDLYAAGVRQFIVSQKIDLKPFPAANFYLVTDTLLALQQLTALHRQKFPLIDSGLKHVIGITGSNGKTIVKEWLYQLMRPDENIVRSPKSYNSQIGVPLSVWQLSEQHTLAIFEAGISQPNEMANLQAIIQPDWGIFTNIGSAHREGFNSQITKIQEKLLLFKRTKVLFCCIDDERLKIEVENWQKEKTERHLFSWSLFDKNADLLIKIEKKEKEFTTKLSTFFRNEKIAIVVPFLDEASLENICHCWAVMLWGGISMSKIKTRMRKLDPVEMRLELKAGLNRCLLINDAYNNDFTSLKIALQFAVAQAGDKKLTLILSDILQSGQESKKLYENVAAAFLEKGFTRLIGIGESVIHLKNILPSTIKTAFFKDTNAFLQAIEQQDFSDEIILLKGARPFVFERIAQRLGQKAHKTVLEINLGALIHNLNVYAQQLKKGTKILAMVKASGYGSGAIEVAKLLAFHQVDYLGVAYADEGIELRNAGINLPILVLNPEANSFETLFRHRLEPEIYSHGVLGDLIAFTGKNKKVAIHLKVDTGMHRLGFEVKDIPNLLKKLQEYPNLAVKSVFSHLSASDAPKHDDFTIKQANTFLAIYNQIKEALGYAPIRHILNTSGIIRFPQYHFDMVRVGIGLYGVDASLTDKNPAALRVVNTLKATISQIKEISAGETVGYNRNAPIKEATRIATISIGYADGLLRLAGSGRYAVLIRGQRAATVGNVCMDMTMVDITHIPMAQEGDEVLIFGEKLPIQGLADCLQTIPYEVLTNISERVKRVYYTE